VGWTDGASSALAAPLHSGPSDYHTTVRHLRAVPVATLNVPWFLENDESKNP